MNKKRCVGLMLVMVMMVQLFALNVGAVGVEPKRAPTVCGNRGYHAMRSTGWASLVRASTGATVLSSAPCWQCPDCYLVMVTQGEPLLGQAIGTYGTWNPGYKISYVTSVRTNNIGYTSSSSLGGYRFSYS